MYIPVHTADCVRCMAQSGAACPHVMAGAMQMIGAWHCPRAGHALVSPTTHRSTCASVRTDKAVSAQWQSAPLAAEMMYGTYACLRMYLWARVWICVVMQVAR